MTVKVFHCTNFMLRKRTERGLVAECAEHDGVFVICMLYSQHMSYFVYKDFKKSALTRSVQFSQLRINIGVKMNLLLIFVHFRKIGVSQYYVSKSGTAVGLPS